MTIVDESVGDAPAAKSTMERPTKKGKKGKGKTMAGRTLRFLRKGKGKGEQSSGGGASSIGLPTQAKHEGHLGFSNQGFEARNLPPALQELFASLNETLKAMGMKGITKSEAQFLLKHALAQMDLSALSAQTPTPAPPPVTVSPAPAEAAPVTNATSPLARDSTGVPAERKPSASDGGWAVAKKQGSTATLMLGRREPRRASMSTDMVNMKAMRAELDSSKEEVLAKEGQISTLTDALKKHQAGADALREELEFMKELLKKSQEENRKNRDRAELLEEELATTRAQLLTHSADSGEGRDFDAALEQIREETEARVAKHKERAVSAIAERQEQEEVSAELKKQLEGALSQVEVLAAENKLQETKYLGIKDQMKEERVRMDALEEELKESQRLMQEQEAVVNNASSVRSMLEEQVSSLKGELLQARGSADASPPAQAEPSSEAPMAAVPAPAPPPPPAPSMAPAPPPVPVAAPPMPSLKALPPSPATSSSGSMLDAIKEQGASRLRHVVWFPSLC